MAATIDEARKILAREARKWGITEPRYSQVHWADTPELNDKFPDTEGGMLALRRKNDSNPPDWAMEMVERGQNMCLLLLDTYGIVRSREPYSS